jgi:hypothetical protein
MKMIAAIKCDKKLYLLYTSINWACLSMLDEFVPNQFKVLNMLSLTGWNSTMSIQDILNQLEDLYGKPMSGALFANNTLLKSPFGAIRAPKLFYHIDKCQEIMTLGKLPYTTKQIIQNALRLLMALNTFPMQEFDMFENVPTNTYPALKMFEISGTPVDSCGTQSPHTTCTMF